MGHGAPDHVQMSDINLLDYADKYFRDDLLVLGLNEHHSICNVTTVGTLGLVSFYTVKKSVILKIIVDGVLMFEESPEIINNWYKATGRAMSDFCGVSAYDAAVGMFGIWVDYHYQMSFKKTLYMELFNGGVATTAHYVRAYWKEKE